MATCISHDPWVMFLKRSSLKYRGSNNGWYWSRAAAELGAAPIYISIYRKHQRRVKGAGEGLKWGLMPYLSAYTGENTGFVKSNWPQLAWVKSFEVAFSREACFASTDIVRTDDMPNIMPTLQLRWGANVFGRAVRVCDSHHGMSCFSF